MVVMQRLGIKEWDADLLKHMASVRGQMGDMEAARDLLQTVITIQVRSPLMAGPSGRPPAAC